MLQDAVAWIALCSSDSVSQHHASQETKESQESFQASTALNVPARHLFLNSFHKWEDLAEQHVGW